MTPKTYDVVVVGGGAAGLSGALVLARARRSVLVVDGGQPRNAPAGHVHNYLAREDTPPAELLAIGRAEVIGYGGSVVADEVISATPVGDEFQLTLVGGGVVRARRLLLATGLVDELPELPGLAERWGRDVLHCPYCHGWEVRDRRIGILAGGPLSAHQAELWRQWSPDVLLLSHREPAPGPEDAERLAALAIPVVPGVVERLEVVDDRLTGVRLVGGQVIELDALVLAPRFNARTAGLDGLGLTPVDVLAGLGDVIGRQLPADPTGATAVPGVWAAGNAADVRAQVITAAAAGLVAGAAINADLIAADTRSAVDDYRQRRRAMFEADAWEERYRSRPALWSGQPNAQLVAEVSGLIPGRELIGGRGLIAGQGLIPGRGLIPGQGLIAGRALDVGSGEGADAIWLAEQGWQVTAVDISATALERGAAHAAAAGTEIAGRISWTRADLREQPPTANQYDLVTAHFMHLPSEPRAELFAGLAAAVAPGGTLLIVGHHPSDLLTSAHRMHFPDMMYTGEELAAALDPTAWEVVAAEARPRSHTDPDGRTITIHDAVLVARRLMVDPL